MSKNPKCKGSKVRKIMKENLKDGRVTGSLPFNLGVFTPEQHDCNT